MLVTPNLLAEVEFQGRDSLHGMPLNGTGVAGLSAEVTHRRAVVIGASALVRTELTDASNRTLTIVGRLSLLDSERLLGEVINTRRVVEHEAFADLIES